MLDKELKKLAEAARDTKFTPGQLAEAERAQRQFHQAVTPQAVLSLLQRIEKLRADLAYYADICDCPAHDNRAERHSDGCCVQMARAGLAADDKAQEEATK